MELALENEPPPAQENRERFNQDLHCGIYSYPEFDKFFKKYSELKYAVLALALGIMMEAINVQYFRNTSFIWREQYHYSEQFTKWLLISNELVQVISLFMIIAWNKSWNRMTWTAGNLTLVATLGIIFVVPEAFHPMEKYENKLYKDVYENSQICYSNETKFVVNDNVPCWSSALVMYIYQFALGSAGLSLAINSITFIDDHVSPKKSVGLLGLLIACKVAGYNIGYYMAFTPLLHTNAKVFITPAWLIICIVTCIISPTIGLFPKNFPNNVRHIVMLYTNSIYFKNDIRSAFNRLAKNQTYIFNVLTAILLFSAIDNISSLKSDLIQTKFYVHEYSSYHKIWQPHRFTSVIEPILSVLIVFCSGIFISKLAPKAITLASWNAIISLLLPVLFSLYLFINCSSDNEVNINNNCSSYCNCNHTRFMPVCHQHSQTSYFSPCHAGCTNITMLNGHKEFTNCACAAVNDTSALVTLGSCGEYSCASYWGFMQILNVIIATVLSSTYVPHIFLTLRCVHNYDRALAIGLEKMLVALITHIPAKLSFERIADKTCQYFYDVDECEFYNSSKFPRFTILLTVMLLITHSLLACLVAFLSKNVELDLHYLNSSKIRNSRNGSQVCVVKEDEEESIVLANIYAGKHNSSKKNYVATHKDLIFDIDSLNDSEMEDAGEYVFDDESFKTIQINIRNEGSISGSSSCSSGSKITMSEFRKLYSYNFAMDDGQGPSRIHDD